MIKCSECGVSQYLGSLFCSECGNFLFDSSGKATAVLPFSEFTYRRTPTPIVKQKVVPSTAIKQLLFDIPGSRRRLHLQVSGEVRVGRADPQAKIKPELDLTQDNGAEYGVSREHALIQLVKQGIILIDLDSTNGTSLNNSRLPPHVPHSLQSGDEIRFGDLLVHLFFD